MSSATVVRAPAGLGKTTLALDTIAQGRGGSVELYVPTHALAEEVGRKLTVANPKLEVQVIGGRSHPGPDGKPLCKQHKLAQEIAAAGGEVYPSLCAREGGKKEERCRYYDSCPYIAQFGSGQVTIYPHAYLPLERMRLEPGVPDVAIIDEAFFSACIGRTKVPISLLRARFLGPQARRICTEIDSALTQELPLLQHLLYYNGIDFDDCQVAIVETRKGAPPMSPKMSLRARRAALATTRQRTQILELLETVRRELFTGRQKSHGVTYCAESQEITIHTKATIRRFRERQRRSAKEVRESRVLILDANADELLAGQFFDDTSFTRLHAARRAEVIQCISTRCSTTSLDSRRHTDPKRKREAKQRLCQVERFIARLAEQHPLLLVVGPQAITGNPSTRVKPRIKVPGNVDLAHFNAIRGIDGWKEHDAIVVIGRNEPPIREVEAIARSVFLNDRPALRFADEWVVQERGYRITGKKLGVDVVCHPDPRIQSIVEQLREGESQQAIDRLRLVHADAPKRVYLLSNLVLDVDVDHLVTWDEMMNGGGRVEQAWSTLQGVMPLAPTWLAEHFPRLWKSADAAKSDVAEWRKECRFTNIFSIGNSSLFQCQYRRAAPPRQRAWSWCLSSNPDPAATRAALEALLVVSVEMRRPEPPAVPLK